MQIKLTNFEQVAAWCEGQPGIAKVIHSEMLIIFEGTYSRFINAGYNWWVIKAGGRFYPMRNEKFIKKYEEVVDG
jgi:hypothetical protein